MRRKQLGESLVLICSWVAVRWGTLRVASPPLSHRSSCPFQSPVCWPPPRAANGTPPPAGQGSSQAQVDKHSCDSSCFKTSMEEVLIKVFKKCITVHQPCTRMCGACIQNMQEGFLWSPCFFLPRANPRVSWMDGNALGICHMQIKAGDAGIRRSSEILSWTLGLPYKLFKESETRAGLWSLHWTVNTYSMKWTHIPIMAPS